ncbi:hypothetical protein [Qipengyuania sp. DGS5-3]|uniref:hypothetical protein n=1 Tax=Qipengyuania sp. DGS5-3 TaxID=3349632 RepID=UPI0036D35BBC
MLKTFDIEMTNEVSIMSYRAKFWSLAALAFGSSLLAGVIIGKTVPSSSGVDNPALVLPVLFLVASAVMFITWLWWRKTDDLQQQGQLISWWWGGNLGAIVMLITLVVMTGRHSEMSAGAGFLFVAEFAGMAIAWLVWKFRGRGAAE